MRNGHLIFSAIQFLLIVALGSLGVGLVVLNRSLVLRQELSEWLLEPGSFLLLLGGLSLGISLLLAIGFFFMQRGSFVRIRMQKGAYSVHEALISRVIQQFWIEHYPEKRRPSEVFVASRKIEIVLEDPSQNLDEIEEHLGEYFVKALGYESEFFVTLRD